MPDIPVLIQTERAGVPSLDAPVDIIQAAMSYITAIYGLNAAGVDLRASATTLASAAAASIGSTPTLKVLISGSATITSFGATAHGVRLLTFQGVLVLTFNATSLILPGGASITTAAGDTALATSDASGNWTIRHYQRANGKSLAGIGTQDASAVAITGGAINGTPIGGTTPAAGAFASLGVTGGLSILKKDASATIASAPFGDFQSNGCLFVADSTGNKRIAIGIATADTGTPGVIQALWSATAPLPLLLNPSGANVGIGLTAPATKLDVAGIIRPGSYTVATVPAGVAGGTIYASNARKVGEASGSGTGVAAYYSNGAWRRPSDDTAIAA